MNARLHLDYGLRYTALTPYKAAWGNAAFSDPASYQSFAAPTVNPKTGFVNLGTGNPYNGMVIPGRSSFPSSAVAHNVVGATPSTAGTACHQSSCSPLFAPKLNDGYVNTSYTIQPRLGFAYEVDQTMVGRAGFGTFATRVFDINQPTVGASRRIPAPM